MAHTRFCQRCGSVMVGRKASKHIADTVRAITGQKIVFEYKCPQCYPDKIADFLNRRDVTN